MNKRISKILLSILLPLSFTSMIIGVGFSAWSFSSDNDSLNKGINIETTGLGEMAKLVRNYDSGSTSEDESVKTNYIVASDSSIGFNYDYYIHFVKGTGLPYSGTIHFPFSLSITTPIVEIDTKISDLMVEEKIISEATNAMSINEMIYTRFYCALACEYDSDYQCAYNSNTNEIPFTSTYFDIDNSALTTTGMVTFSTKSGLFWWKHGIQLSETSTSNIPSSFYISSASQIYMSYSPIYNKLMSSSKANTSITLSDNSTVTTLKSYIVEKARYVLSNTSLKITYGLEYTKTSNGEEVC